MRAALCDDEKIFLEHMRELLVRDSFVKNYEVTVMEFTGGGALLAAWREGLCADVIFLDICMEGIDGMETARRLRREGCGCLIVFLTGVDTYLQEGYEVRAFRYLMKDQAEDALGRVMDACRQELMVGEVFTFSSAHGNFRIPLPDILYLESDKRRILLHTSNETHCFYGRLDNLEAQLADKGFLRCHRSYLVNVRYVSGWKGGELFLRDGAVLPISRSCEKEVERRLLLREGSSGPA